MRVTVPNPLGPPITFDSANFGILKNRFVSIIPSVPTSRRNHLRLLLLPVILLTVFFWYPSPPFPPSYSLEKRTEYNLPQLSGKVGYPEGSEGRFIKFDVPRGTGFNHQLQRVLLQHHLAVLGNRSLAFEPYVEDDTEWPFRVSEWPWRSAKIPLSAFLSTVVSGFEAYYHTPRAVPAWHFRRVCPPYKQRVYTLKTEANPEGDLALQGDGQARIHQLQVLLLGSEVGCIRIVGEVFDDAFFDSDGPMQLFDSFIQSPVMKHFSFSPTVLSILNRFMPEIAPDYTPYNLEKIQHTTSKIVPKVSMWKHVLALHLRKGDNWEAVCEEKGMRSAPFVSFNKLPLLPGNENVPPPPEMVEATRMGLYRAKCSPSTLDVIARARRMRKNHPLLRMVYILTDADDEWAEEMRMWLASEGWDKVFVGKRDFYDNFEDREVGVGVDMEVARRAGVFVGNGFSTTASNIVLLRTVDGIHPDLTQFW